MRIELMCLRYEGSVMPLYDISNMELPMGVEPIISFVPRTHIPTPTQVAFGGFFEAL